MGEADADSGLPSQRPTGKLVNLVAGAGRHAARVRGAVAGDAVRQVVVPRRGSYRSPRAGSFGLWFEKRRDPQIAFVWVVKAPRIRARVFDSFFGPYLIPK